MSRPVSPKSDPLRVLGRVIRWIRNGDGVLGAAAAQLTVAPHDQRGAGVGVREHDESDARMSGDQRQRDGGKKQRQKKKTRGGRRAPSSPHTTITMNTAT